MCKLHKLGNLFALKGWPVVPYRAVAWRYFLSRPSLASTHMIALAIGLVHIVLPCSCLCLCMSDRTVLKYTTSNCAGAKRLCRAWGQHTAQILGIKHGSVSAPRFQENWHTAVKISADHLLWYNKSGRLTRNSKISFDGGNNVVNYSSD